MNDSIVDILRKMIPLAIKRPIKRIYLNFCQIKIVNAKLRYRQGSQLSRTRGTLSKMKNKVIKVDRTAENNGKIISVKNGFLDRRKAFLDVIEKHNRLYQSLSKTAPILRSLKFAEYCRENENELKADIYVSHDVLPLIGADVLAQRNGGRIFCNVIEIPDFRNRATKPPWRDEIFSAINAQTNGYLGRCDLLITVGPTLANHLKCYGPPVWILENYRYKEPFNYSKELREKCGSLKCDDVLILSLSTVVTGFEAVVEAFKLLPKKYHLAVIGKFYPKDYGQEIFSKVNSLGLSERFHFFDFVPYKELTKTASGADMGLIVRDPSIVNNYVSLPNRVFDYLSSGLPILTPQIPDIAQIVAKYQVGIVVRELTADGWAAAILGATENLQKMRRNAIELANRLTWESKEQKIINQFSPANRVTFLGMGDLTLNNRTKRIALTLAKAGISITICAVSNGGGNPEHPNIKYHRIPKLT